MHPSRLEVEVTESVPLTNSKEVLRALERIRESGVSISLDDFGTGFSALSYLLRYQFDKIKIDRSFVAGLGDSHKADSVVRAMLGVARGMGMIALAEGVENERQAAILKAEGCLQAQGYYFGRPQTAQSIVQLFDAAAAKTGVRAGAAAA
jgi:EAL domain-containing protein (putative c-di-GMP-specific phosphodiesterase class I)